jgi:hypothetical protein
MVGDRVSWLRNLLFRCNVLSPLPMVGHSEPLVTCQRSFPIRQINVIAVETPVLTSARPKKNPRTAAGGHSTNAFFGFGNPIKFLPSCTVGSPPRSSSSPCLRSTAAFPSSDCGSRDVNPIKGVVDVVVLSNEYPSYHR